MSVIANGAHLFGASALANSLQLGAANVASLDPASSFASGCESSYSLARGPLFFSQGGGGGCKGSSIARLMSVLENLDDSPEESSEKETNKKLDSGIKRWWGWTERGTELERIAATHLLGMYVTKDGPRRLEGIERLVAELYSESARRRVAALFALDRSIYFLDRKGLIEIGRRLIERGESEPLAVWNPDGQKIEIDPSKFIHLRVAFGLLALCALSRDHEDPLIRFYSYIMDATHVRSGEELGLEHEYEPAPLGDPSEADFPIGDFSLDEWFEVDWSLPIEEMSIQEADELFGPLNELLVQDDPFIRLAGYIGLRHVQCHSIGPSSAALTLLMIRGFEDDDESVRFYVEGVVDGALSSYGRSMERAGKDMLGGFHAAFRNDLLMLADGLIDLLKRHDVPYAVRTVASQLGKISKVMPIEDQARVVEDLLAFSKGDADPSVRATAVVGLMQAAYAKGDPSSFGIDIETIVAFSADEHAEIRAATVDGLFSLALDGILGEEDEVLRKVFIRLEGDESEIVRERLSYAKDVMAFE